MLDRLLKTGYINSVSKTNGLNYHTRLEQILLCFPAKPEIILSFFHDLPDN